MNIPDHSSDVLSRHIGERWGSISDDDKLASYTHISEDRYIGNDDMESSFSGGDSYGKRVIPGKRKVIQLHPETEEVLNVFPSITSAANACQTSHPDKIMSLLVSISRSCRKKQRQAGGYKWRFYDDYENQYPESTDNPSYTPMVQTGSTGSRQKNSNFEVRHISLNLSPHNHYHLPIYQSSSSATGNNDSAASSAEKTNVPSKAHTSTGATPTAAPAAGAGAGAGTGEKRVKRAYHWKNRPAMYGPPKVGIGS